MSAASAAAQRLRVAPSAVAARLEAVRPVPALAALVALQLGQAFWFGFHTPHNGWIWYSGGDATSYWTEQWAIGHLQIPQAVVGYGLPVYYAWVPLVAGPSLVNGAAIIVLFQAIVLVPLALILFWAVADKLFGRVYAWFSVALWVAGPLLLLHGFVPGYHWVFEQLFLAPHWFGFTNMADLPSLVLVLACVWLTLRAVESGSPTDTLIAGLLGGVAIGVKPSNAFVLPAIAVLLAGIGRPRQLGLWAAALLPALATLLLWKVRGLGYLPLTSNSYERLHLAAGAHPLAFSTGKYLPIDFHHLGQELANLREVYWSLRFLEFLVVAGAFGVIRKAPLKGLFIVVWFASFGIVKASSPRSDFPSATYFRLVEPALPAFILLIVGIAFCVPRIGKQVRSFRRVQLGSTLDLRRVIPAIAVLALIPLALIVIAQPASAMQIVRDGLIVQEAPLTRSLGLHVTRNRDASVTLTWRTPHVGRTHPWFVVYTSAETNGCDRPSRGALECMLDMPILTVTQGHMVVDHPGTGPHFYRVALVAQYQSKTAGGDLMLVSRSVFVPHA